MPQHFVNNWSATLTATAAAGATSISATDIEGLGEKLEYLRLSPVSATDPLVLTLDDGAGTIEIVKCTAIGASLTVERAQEGTTAVEWLTGSTIECRATAATLERAHNSSFGAHGTARVHEIVTKTDTIIIAPDVDKIVMVTNPSAVTLDSGTQLNLSVDPGDLPTVASGIEVYKTTVMFDYNTFAATIAFPIGLTDCIGLQHGESFTYIYNVTTNECDGENPVDMPANALSCRLDIYVQRGASASAVFGELFTSVYTG